MDVKSYIPYKKIYTKIWYSHAGYARDSTIVFNLVFKPYLLSLSNDVYMFENV